jgi:hypothetical protein
VWNKGEEEVEGQGEKRREVDERGGKVWWFINMWEFAWYAYRLKQLLILYCVNYYKFSIFSSSLG